MPHNLSLNYAPTGTLGVVSVSVDTVADTLTIRYKAGWTKRIHIHHADAQQLVSHDAAISQHGARPGL